MPTDPVAAAPAFQRPRAAATQPTEKELERTLLEACRILGYRAAHFRPALTKHGWRTAVAGDGQGFPDWVLAHDRAGHMFVELKAKRGRLTLEQRAWGEALIRAGAIYRVVQGRDEVAAFIQELADRSIKPVTA